MHYMYMQGLVESYRHVHVQVLVVLTILCTKKASQILFHCLLVTCLIYWYCVTFLCLSCTPSLCSWGSLSTTDRQVDLGVSGGMAAPQRQWAAHSELHPTVLVKILYCQCYSLISNSCMTKISFVEEELNLIELNNQYNKENFSFCIITKFTKLKTSNYKICIEKFIADY